MCGSDSDLNFAEHEFIPQTIVPHNPSAELGLLSPDGVVKQSPPKRRAHRTQDLRRKPETNVRETKATTLSAALGSIRGSERFTDLIVDAI